MQKKDKYFDLIRRQEESGFNVSEFCSNEGIAKSTFYYWVKKRKKESRKSDFIPLILNNMEGRLPKNGFRREKSTDIINDPESQQDQIIELTYPNGVTLRVGKNISLAQLKLLIQL